MSRTNVVAVVVAYNRQELLRRCLDGLAGQTAPPAGTVVVDNASTDASARVAAGHPLGAHVVSLPVNTGGAGGFAAGIARARLLAEPALIGATHITESRLSRGDVARATRICLANSLRGILTARRIA